MRLSRLAPHARRTRRWLAAAALAAAAVPASANDAYTTIGAGGLVMSKTEDVAMVREYLDVSVREIKVRYVFRNRSAKDVKATVSFPLPQLAYGTVMNSPLALKRGEGDPNFSYREGRGDFTPPGPFLPGLAPTRAETS